MKIKTIYAMFIAMSIAFASTAQVIQESKAPREKWSLESMEGTVKAINKETRDITLMGPEGNLVTVNAGDEVARFDEIAVDDRIVFEYYTYMKAEFREPTLAERAEPVAVIAEAGKAPEGMDPGAVVGAIVKAIVTIEVLNRPFQSATIKGPRGNYMTVPVADLKFMETLHIGQELIFTYAEAVAISLKKLDANNN